MLDAVEHLRGLEYPGRFIILGRASNGDNVAVYGITGRSESSKSRKLIQKVDDVIVQPIDASLINDGNSDLLIYTAMSFTGDRLFVANGNQMRDLKRKRNHDLLANLGDAHLKWDYEPDQPNYTSRISGVVGKDQSAIGIIKRDRNEDSVKNYFASNLFSGVGRFISTYLGANQNPVPSFVGEPVDVSIREISAKRIARTAYDALAKEDADKDFRVSVVTATFNPVNFNMRSSVNYAIINRFEE